MLHTVRLNRVSKDVDAVELPVRFLILPETGDVG